MYSPGGMTTMMVASMAVTISTPPPRKCLVTGGITTSAIRHSLTETREQPVLLCPESLIGSCYDQFTLSYTPYINGRYFGTQRRTDFIGSVSSGGATDFRHYNYRRVPYLGGSDHFSYLNRTVMEAQMMRGIE